MVGPRPGGVTLVAIIAWINGVLTLITGILLLVGGAASDAAPVMWVAWLSIIIGILTIAVGVGLLRGNNTARIVAAVVFALNLVSAVITMFTAPNQLWSAIISAALAVIGLVLLFSEKANEFFRTA
ncbi:hypothetical protein [Agromyces sp. Marseille-P2726]|uniref:DUF7144 family membrane protein n=1 Tax=Agromyces sp. Marseille-P2726 TaxID=2709132 RepID=UPI00156D653B|nr:hypothetical protein [Agromyces sp. Marseille-P2726]